MTDISRKTFRKEKHYSGVIAQQGRVNLDADWNEQLDLQLHRTHTEAIDVIGPFGAPYEGDSFKVEEAADGSADFRIMPGRIYIGGLLLELDEEASYLRQPYYPQPDTSFIHEEEENPTLEPCDPQPPGSGLKDGTYIVYIKAWQREITYLDDPYIQETALGEADTAARLQNVWQVRLLKTEQSDIGCETPTDEWNDLINPPSGMMKVRTMAPDEPQDPCAPPPRAGFLSMENQFYRIQIHRGGSREEATWKFSRDNATVETVIEGIAGNVLTVGDIGKDEVKGFSPGQWVEIINSITDLNQEPHPLFQIEKINPVTHEITLKPGQYQPEFQEGMKLLRWDQYGPAAGPEGLSMPNGWADVEDGIQVSFSAGTYRAGDYWHFPARVATSDVEWPPYTLPNVSPLPQAPHGYAYHYGKLAIITAVAGNINILDCRPLFNNLTEISDWGLNNLRDHNKHLHGHGVVCGLKVKCGPVRDSVVIGKGYALDCEGRVLRITAPQGKTYNIVAEAQAKGLLDNNGNGLVSIVIGNGSAGAPRVSIEKFVKKDFWDEILEGGIWKDFFEGCISNLFVFLKAQLPADLDDTPPVPIEQRRLTALINLLIQWVNTASGPYGFISGEADPGRNDQACGPGSNAMQSEDKLLWCFYKDLQRLLASQTYCAMYDNDAPYPDYQLDAGLRTLFGPAIRVHHRLILHPTRPLAYTCGYGNKIYVYHLEKREMVEAISFPSNKNISLQDLAVSPQGNELYAVGILENKDSVFAKFSISAAGRHTAAGSSVHCGSRFMRLATDPDGKLFATAKTRGLFEIVKIGEEDYAANLLREFNATGLLHITANGKLILAAGHTGAAESDDFNEILIIHNEADYKDGTAIKGIAGGDFDNDIATLGDSAFVTFTRNGTRMVGEFFLPNGGHTNHQIEIDDSWLIRLAVHSGSRGDFLFLSFSDLFKVQRIDLSEEGHFRLAENFRVPVQFAPVAIVMDNAAQRGYALNAVVNTLTEMDMRLVMHTAPAPNYTMEPPTVLSDYRDEALQAYRDVFSHFLQYLKDCFCDKFLVDCPDCDPNKKVYLGVVDIRDCKVHHICNFSKRKYVKTMPTLEYWLSTVPVLPMMEQAFSAFCCSVFDLSQINRFFDQNNCHEK